VGSEALPHASVTRSIQANGSSNGSFGCKAVLRRRFDGGNAADMAIIEQPHRTIGDAAAVEPPKAGLQAAAAPLL
jgi:hypothetical protein